MCALDSNRTDTQLLTLNNVMHSFTEFAEGDSIRLEDKSQYEIKLNKKMVGKMF